MRYIEINGRVIAEMGTDHEEEKRNLNIQKNAIVEYYYTAYKRKEITFEMFRMIEYMFTGNIDVKHDLNELCENSINSHDRICIGLIRTLKHKPFAIKRSGIGLREKFELVFFALGNVRYMTIPGNMYSNIGYYCKNPKLDELSKHCMRPFNLTTKQY